MQTFTHGGAEIAAFHDAKTGSWQYVVVDPATRAAAIIDPVLDFDETAAATSTRNAEAILAFVRERELRVEWILDTHPHADHFSAAPWLQAELGAPTAIGEKVTGVQALWKDLYGLPDDFPTDGRQWDRLFREGETFRVGELPARVMFSPGHTPASITYVIGDNAFVHDTLMMPDAGTSRADFPGGDAHALYCSIRDILALPDDTGVFVGHDYGPDGREPACFSTVAAQKARNIHVGGDRSEADFVALRQRRDATLPLPKLMLYALQVNIRGGRLPEPEADGRVYFRIPANRFEPPEEQA
ncbi:MBL fold metallo-hydrolase [Brevundimonas viscosa]|uniref:Glyoxylase, beta-lactamase superfamily II n=1 Tax=Brevundimonas viscosa TaxID=871741 RepID=A0A1I6QFL0_9CAUL|nr:MBL fold metallo-hydrolase [Brevundimonas viscosa]SFS51293.1 Glyoxylase, beta-lactamase superfamily II [Brevundimonas viscosa]